ncbi:phosphotransferase [Phaeobacter sp. BS52]|uniref:phosphotransferase n=1 Tax=Phaeobacter sp. BS52 TaxID=2907241 RepID=UPI0038695A8E
MSDARPSPLLGGRSNRVWRLGGIVVKLYGDSHANPLFANDAAREYAALQALNGTALVPELLTSGQFEGHDWLAYRHSPGVTWSSGSAEVAALLGRLHAQPVIPGLLKQVCPAVRRSKTRPSPFWPIAAMPVI